MLNSDEGNIQDAVAPSLGITMLVAVTLALVLFSFKIALEAIH